MFRKYGHIKTRYDEIKERDKEWKHEKAKEYIMKRLDEIFDFKETDHVYICGRGKLLFPFFFLSE